MKKIPQPIFDALEIAVLIGEEFATVDKELFDKMIEGYRLKTSAL